MGANVVLTRTGQSTHLTLEDRANMANSLHADLFVSVHADASTNRQISGTTTFFFAPLTDPILGAQRFDRMRLARLVQDGMVTHGGRDDRGIRERSFAVIRLTHMPSILVETAFISNLEEEQLLNNPVFQERIARGIAEGIERFFQ
jgi:N-acetylmuramoyl-L-alanine amidase